MGWLKGVLIAVAIVLVTVAIIYGASQLDQKKSRHPAPAEEAIPTLIVDLPAQKQDDLLLMCNENEYQTGFERFRQFVQIGTQPIAVPGGPMLVAVTDVQLDSTLQAPKRALVEVLKRHTPRRVVLMSHDGCLYYDTVSAWLNDPSHVRVRQYADLARAESVVHTWFPNATVEVWHGERYGQQQMRFRPVPADTLSRAMLWFAADSSSR